jgi:hypothetical protein
MAGAVWVYRDELRPVWDAAVARWQQTRAQPSDAAKPDDKATAELAERAQVKLDAVRTGEQRQASFTSDELQSLLQFRYRQVLPAFIDSPRVTLEGDQVRLRMRVPADRLPSVKELGEVASMLPDTTDLDIHGQLLPSDDGRVAFAVDKVSAHRIPLPKRLVPAALEMLGRTDQPGLPADAILVPLPKGARTAYVRGDSLVLLAETQASPRN